MELRQIRLAVVFDREATLIKSACVMFFKLRYRLTVSEKLGLTVESQGGDDGKLLAKSEPHKGFSFYLWFYLGIPQPEGVQGAMRGRLPKRDTRAFGIGTTSSESRAVDIRISSGAEPRNSVIKHSLHAGMLLFRLYKQPCSFLPASMGRLAPLKRSLRFLKVPGFQKRGFQPLNGFVTFYRPDDRQLFILLTFGHTSICRSMLIIPTQHIVYAVSGFVKGIF